MFEGMTKNLLFLCFMAVFMLYYLQCEFPGGFLWLVRPDTCLRVLTKNSSISCIMAVFMSYCPQFWGSRVIYNDPKTRYMFESSDQKLVVFHVLWPFSWAIAHFFGALGGFTVILRPDTCLRVMTKNSSFSRFRVIFISYSTLFLCSTRICMDRKTRCMFKGITNNSSFLCFMTIFMSYSTVLGFQSELQQPLDQIHFWQF